MIQIRSSVRRIASRMDGEIAASSAVAAVCLTIGGIGWLVNRISPGSTQLSALTVPGLLYLFMGAGRLPALLGPDTEAELHTGEARTAKATSAETATAPATSSSAGSDGTAVDVPHEPASTGAPEDDSPGSSAA